MDDITMPFRPGTISWDVLRQPVYLLGGMNALLLQLADPRVAAGVAEHSDFSSRIFDRLRHTVELMVEVGLGEPAEAERALREMDRVHAGVQGTMPDGSTYDAGDPELRLWVLATLIHTVLTVEETYVGEFTEDDRRRYYRESLEVARVLDVGDTPDDLNQFRSYMTHRLASLEVSDVAREIARHVLHPRIGKIPPFSFAPFRVITADLLPARLRDEYGLCLSPRHHKWLRRAQTSSRAVIPRMPGWVRTFPLLRPTSVLWERVSNVIGPG